MPSLALANERPRRCWLSAFLVTFALAGFWALASPTFSGPDEPAQVLRSVSLVHGTILGRPEGGPISPATQVSVPRWLAGVGGAPDCFKGRPDTTAACEPPLSTSPGSVSETTYAGRYPPLYYAVVGWPSLVTSGKLALYLMRLASAAASAIFLAGAISVARRSRHARGLLAGIAVAATPQVFFLAGVINPSGLEVSAAICLWTAAVVACEEPGAPGALAWLAGAGAVTANLRGLSPFWVLVIGLSVAAYAGRRRVRALMGDRRAQVGLAVLVAFGAIAVAWIFAAGALRVRPSGTPFPPGTGPWLALGLTLENLGPETLQMVGVFGWVDTYLPVACYVLWLGFAAAVACAGVAVAPLRRRAVLVGFGLATVAVPAIILVSRGSTLGIFGQARDWMPLWVGLPILAGHAIGQWAIGGQAHQGTLHWRRTPVALAVVGLQVLQVVAWAWALRRYSTGSGHVAINSPAAWSPPLPAPVLLAGVVIGALGLAGCCWALPPWRRASGGRRRT
ncbi:MAG: DUF2142 domain-containing protein [Acidimicrobiales bacterium]